MELWMILIFFVILLEVIISILDYNLLHSLYKDAETPSIIASIFFLPIFLGCLLLGAELTDIRLIILAMASGLLLFMSSYLYSICYAKKIPPGTTLGIWKIQMIFAFIVGVLFLGESLTALQYVGHGIIFLGALLLSLNHFSAVQHKYYLIFPVIGALACSISVIGNDLLYIGNDFITVFGGFSLGFFLGAPILIFFTQAGRRFYRDIPKNWRKYAVIGCIVESLNIGAVILLNYSLKIGPLSLVVFLKETYVALLIVVSFIFGYFYPKYFPDGGKSFSFYKLCIIIAMVGGVYLAIA